MSTASSSQQRVTLRQQVHRDCLPPTPNASRKRVMDLHTTGFPGVLNADLLPERALQATDFTDLDPLSYRKNHTVQNNNKGSMDDSKLKPGDSRACSIPMVTTSQLTSRLLQMGLESRRNPDLQLNSMQPRGYHSKWLSPSLDNRSTYRLDYCGDDPAGFHVSHRRTMHDYQANWTDDEKANVAASVKYPYLTIPQTECQKRTTVYRHDYVPEASSTDFRTVSYKTDLQELGTGFAFSAYTADDPRRQTTYRATTTHPGNLNSLLDKTYSPQKSFRASQESKQSAVRDELLRLRDARRATLQRSVEAKHAASQAALSDAALRKKPVVLPGLRGLGYRRAPAADDDNYISLPREHFRYDAVYDY